MGRTRRGPTPGFAGDSGAPGTPFPSPGVGMGGHGGDGGGHTAHALQRGGAAGSWRRGSAVAAPRRGGRDGAARPADPPPSLPARRKAVRLLPLPAAEPAPHPPGVTPPLPPATCLRSPGGVTPSPPFPRGAAPPQLCREGEPRRGCPPRPATPPLGDFRVGPGRTELPPCSTMLISSFILPAFPSLVALSIQCPLTALPSTNFSNPFDTVGKRT